jgi:transcriptional regulator with XRE-family HTH domain
MRAKRQSFSDQLRRAVDDCGLSRYKIAKELGVNQSLLSRFMAGAWLGQETMDALAELLDLHVSTGKRATQDAGTQTERTGKGKRK